jgi:RsiW-degrading membrane proteinase PrsW (M82 family)
MRTSKQIPLQYIVLVAILGFYSTFLINNEIFSAQLAITLTLLLNLMLIYVEKLNKIKEKVRTLLASFVIGVFFGVLLL